jgi:hypothetical protein
MKKHITNSIASIPFIVTFLGISLSSYSQERKHEFYFVLGGVSSFMQYDLPAGKLTPGNGFSAGIRYSYYLNEGLSLGIGAEYQLYNSAASFKSLSGQYTTTDIENESFEFKYKATDLREEQKLAYINIPIAIQFETPGTTKLYLAAGAKIGFAASGSYQATIGNLTTTGYYPQYNVELPAPAFAGFASKDNVKEAKQDLDTKISYAATFETGVKQIIGKKKSIYLGAYFDYSLNNIYDKKDQNIIQYSNQTVPVKLQYNTVLNSASTNKMTLVSYGLKLRFAIR